MNADEIVNETVKALRCHADPDLLCGECPYWGSSDCGRRMAADSADLIESLQGQLTEVTQLALDVTGKYETSVKMHQITNSALSASQARERAAVEMLKSANLCRQCAYDAQCGSTNHYRQQKRIYGHCDHWQWRGLQDVEEGK